LEEVAPGPFKGSREAAFFFEDRTAEAIVAAPAIAPMAIFEPVPRFGEIFFLRFLEVFPTADRTGFEGTARASFLGFAALRATGFLAMGFFAIAFFAITFFAIAFLIGFFTAMARLGAFAVGRFAEAFGFALVGFALILLTVTLLFFAGFAAFFVDLAIGV